MKLRAYRLPAIVFLLHSLRAGAVDPLVFNPVDAYVECEPVVFSWSGAPYEVGVLGTELEVLPTTNDTSITWVVDFPAGIVLRAAVTDFTTLESASIPALTIMAGINGTQRRAARARQEAVLTCNTPHVYAMWIIELPVYLPPRSGSDQQYTPPVLTAIRAVCCTRTVLCV
ncbi:hypothetical protein GGX14DRAFT_558770 [Mycena pura]|uniref:Uncharacterized protein n=1 Tax=Mycena pura TaxID=153505 RepID=A0AAD6VS49_9AGAR|nr:hypothetical protein GGX14DRAFT_558770 [Mycena pura]